MSADTETEKELAVIIMGSESDDPHASKIAKVFEDFGVDYVKRVASAHKAPDFALGIVREYSRLALVSGKSICFVTIAGRSDALTHFVDAATVCPVTACPPPSEKYGGMDVLSSLRSPSGIGSAVTLEPEAAALHTIKMFALGNSRLRDSLEVYHNDMRIKIYHADAKVRGDEEEKA